MGALRDAQQYLPARSTKYPRSRRRTRAGTTSSKATLLAITRSPRAPFRSTLQAPRNIRLRSPRTEAESTCAKGLDTAAKTLAGCNFEMQSHGKLERSSIGTEMRENAAPATSSEPADNHHMMYSAVPAFLSSKIFTQRTNSDPNNPNGPLGTTQLHRSRLAHQFRPCGARPVPLEPEPDKFTIKGSMNEIDPRSSRSNLPAAICPRKQQISWVNGLRVYERTGGRLRRDAGPRGLRFHAGPA